jgi:hypothetical protein
MKIHPRWRWIALSVLIVVILPVIVLGAWVWGTLHFAYSDGVRTGYVQKISKRGWFCKTWEGELAMSPVPGSAPQIFQFSVPDSKVAEAIERTSGHQVSLAYEQHRGVPSACFGETEYFVTGVKPTGP